MEVNLTTPLLLPIPRQPHPLHGIQLRPYSPPSPQGDPSHLSHMSQPHPQVSNCPICFFYLSFFQFNLSIFLSIYLIFNIYIYFISIFFYIYLPLKSIYLLNLLYLYIFYFYLSFIFIFF